jgi:cytochrome c oxidase cbb3-type subunit 3
MSDRVSLFIIVFTVINIVACLWLMWWTARTRTSTAPEEDKSEQTGHVWDGDLTEYNNPLPRWWLGLFIITIVFAFGYLALYPGLGTFKGTKDWTAAAQWEKQMAEQRARLDAHLATLKDMSLHDLAGDAGAMATAKNIFGQTCSTCHGSDARGAKGFPNLADADWLWGDAEDRVLETIASGRHGIMPSLGTALGDDGVEQVASYVFSLNGREAPADWVAAGKERFAQLCAGCHGVDARGNQLMGAPNLTDDVWLHGGDFASIKATITNGRDNQMPAHLEMLGETRVKLLAAYVLSLSQNSAGAEPTLATEPAIADGRTAAATNVGTPAAPAKAR